MKWARCNDLLEWGSVVSSTESGAFFVRRGPSLAGFAQEVHGGSTEVHGGSTVDKRDTYDETGQSRL